MTQSRLQQACDSGVLAARKKLGSDLPPSAAVLGQVRKAGDAFFDLNFPEGRYETADRSFVMTLEEDFAISGTASAVLPTAIMGLFGKETIPVNVSCQSRMNFTNLDIMMVLDVTGSMRATNTGDAMPRIDVMRSVIKGFHGNLEASKAPDTRVRYGFVPYATNVNVGGLLDDDWVANQWTYQSRIAAGNETSVYYGWSWQNYNTISGNEGDWYDTDTYAPTPTAGNSDALECARALPEDTYAIVTETISTVTEPFVGPPEGTITTETVRRTETGSKFNVYLSGGTCIEQRKDFDNFIQERDRVTRPYERNTAQYTYKPVSLDMTNWRTSASGCIEERDTYEITDYDNVDLSRALDLDIDTVPTAGNLSTQWRPHHPSAIYARQVSAFGGGDDGELITDEITNSEYYALSGLWWMSDCPAPAQKLAEMDASSVDTYLNSLEPEGSTYHDIGMIWGARMLSPDGIFAADNVDESGNKPTTRHLIFLTDGQTEPYDIAYGTYGIEGLDRRRWTPDSVMPLTETIDNRFLFACNEAKKKNITVWIIAFGTYVNPAMTQCAGDGKYFEADSAAQLDNAFASIARSMGDLRVSK